MAVIAILIDPNARSVDYINWDGDWRSIAGILGAQHFDAVRFDDEHADVALIDDEGLLAAEPGPFFMFRGFGQPLAGKALVLGTNDEGDSVEPVHDAEAIRRRVLWVDAILDGQIFVSPAVD